MPTKPYMLDGKRLPSVTTILSGCKLGGIDGLLSWANELGKQGRDFREVRQEAADAGTACHEMVECFAKRIPFDESKYPPEIMAKAKPAYAAFEEWGKQTNLTIEHSEVSLVSPTYRYGGTMDCILVNGLRSLGDVKTSNGVHPDMLCQLAAYRALWEENRPDEPITGGFHLMRFSKPKHEDDPVSFHHHYWSQLDIAWIAFKHMRELYDLHKRLKDML